MHIHRYERWWMTFGLAMLVVFMATIFIAAFADNINPPTGSATIEPTKVGSTPPFDHPGLRQTADGNYEAYYVAQVFMFSPSKLTIPLGSTVTFYVTSSDVVHGFEIARTDINIMAIPGWVNSATYRFTKAGTYLLVCNEYCGIGHQNMYGTIEVK
ncbi:MAG TPA: cytochrome c oxidase subunit II [Candidatus Baltobacteraceae bacterium]|nr:cytochrome c oxidase subunit II [Candidatus Baltobacteraceae bacterium]